MISLSTLAFHDGSYSIKMMSRIYCLQLADKLVSLVKVMILIGTYKFEKLGEVRKSA